MQKAGYLPVATFVVPESCWTNYYSIMQKTHASFLKKHKGNKTAEEFVSYQRYEAELYYKYKEYYGYVFYIERRSNLNEIQWKSIFYNRLRSGLILIPVLNVISAQKFVRPGYLSYKWR